VLLNRLVHGLNLASAVAAPRIHSQLWPDQISMEQGISPDTIRLLERQRHNVVLAPSMGSANSVEVRTGSQSDELETDSMKTYGYADQRRLGSAAIAE
jgi:gamma-glutamyltranspeptidase/glutathione hydrolase